MLSDLNTASKNITFSVKVYKQIVKIKYCDCYN